MPSDAVQYSFTVLGKYWGYLLDNEEVSDQTSQIRTHYHKIALWRGRCEWFD